MYLVIIGSNSFGGYSLEFPGRKADPWQVMVILSVFPTVFTSFLLSVSLVNKTLSEFLRKLSHVLEHLTLLCLCLHGRGAALRRIDHVTEQNCSVASTPRIQCPHGVLLSSDA